MSNQPRRSTPHNRRARRGSAYVPIIGLSMVIGVLAIAALLAARVQRRSSEGVNDSAEARQYALAAISLGRNWVNADPNWRANRTPGVWVSNQAFGGGSFTLEANDPNDGDFTNDLYDPLVFKATGCKGCARQVIEVRLRADPRPLPALKYAIHSGGRFRVRPGVTLFAGTATVSTNDALRNEGAIIGSAECRTVISPGMITGLLTISAGSKAFPPASTIDYYVSRGTPIVPGSNTIEKRVLSPASNPWGAPNPDGIYVLRASADLTLREVRIVGTLVVINPGKKLTITQSVNLAAARPDFPALIVQGNAVLDFDANPLSEADNAVNFNPPGTPYQGSADGDFADTYPSEIRGLIHVTGTSVFQKDGVVRGAVLCESSAGTDTPDVTANKEIFYDSRLYSLPPQGYTTSVPMVVEAGSWRQLVD
jgi:hypothetical protein